MASPGPVACEHFGPSASRACFARKEREGEVGQEKARKEREIVPTTPPPCGRLSTYASSPLFTGTRSTQSITYLPECKSVLDVKMVCCRQDQFPHTHSLTQPTRPACDAAEQNVLIHWHPGFHPMRSMLDFRPVPCNSFLPSITLRTRRIVPAAWSSTCSKSDAPPSTALHQVSFDCSQFLVPSPP